MAMIEWWTILPDGRRMATKRAEVGRQYRFVTAFEDTDGINRWWCHAFYSTEGYARGNLKRMVNARDLRLVQAGLDPAALDLADRILPAYFLKKVKA